MRLGKTAIVHFGSQVAISVTGFVATFVIAVVLGADGLGQYRVVAALAFWLLVPGNAVKMAIRKRMSEGGDRDRYFGTGLLLNAAIALVLVGALLLVDATFQPVEDPSRAMALVLDRYTILLAGLVVGTLLFKTVIGALHGEHRVAGASVLKAGERVARVAVQVALLLAGYGVAGLVVGHAASLVVAGVVGLVVVHVRPSVPGADAVRSVVEYARYAWLSALRGKVFGWMDTIVLSLFVGAGLIGVYEAAWGVASMLGVLGTSISQALFPEISERSAREDLDRVRHYLDEALAFAGVIVIPGLFGALVVGERVLRFYGPEFGRGHVVLVLLVFAYVADTYATQFLYFTNGLDAPDRAFRVNATFVVVNTVLNVALVATVGWVGAAVATVVSAGVRTVYGYYVVVDILGAVDVPLEEVGRQVLAALAMAVATLLVDGLVAPGRVGTLLVVGLGAGTYSLVLLTVSQRVRSKVRSLVPARAQVV